MLVESKELGIISLRSVPVSSYCILYVEGSIAG